MTRDVIAYIRARPAPGDTVEEHAARLNARMVDNPRPQRQVLPPVSARALVAMLSVESRARVINWPNLSEVLRAIERGDRGTLGVWVGLMADAELIQKDEQEKLVAAVGTPVPDSAWQARIPEPMAMLGRLVTSDDIRAAREAG